MTEIITPQLEAIRFFFGNITESTISSLGNGNINDTWLIHLENKNKYVLQRINSTVFKNPKQIVENQLKITSHLHAQIQKQKIPVKNFSFIQLLSGNRGEYCFQSQDRSIWRVLTYIQNNQTHQTITNTKQAYELGRALSLFHRLCKNLNPKTVTDLLPDFHNTPCYLKKFDKATTSTSRYLGENFKYCLKQINTMRGSVNQIEEHKNKLASQIIHGDPKVANFLFQQNSDKVISLIDLDTVKPGLLLYDIGDALRSCCNLAGENATLPETAAFSRQFFKSWLAGYLQTAQYLLTKDDLERIVAATWLITFELGLRFLTDYLSDDHYFKTSYPEHNLHRAQIQFSVADSIQSMTRQLEDDVWAALNTSVTL